MEIKHFTGDEMKETKTCCSGTDGSTSVYKNTGFGKYVPYLLVILGILFLYNTFTLFGTNQVVNDAIAVKEEAAVPLNIELTVITVSGCDDCFDITPIIDAVRGLHVKITLQNELQSDSMEAQMLIDTYSIKKLPAIILTGELSKKEDVAIDLETLFEKVSDTTLLFEALNPPYLDVASKEIVGRVHVTALTAPDCEECKDISSMVTALKKVMTIADVKEVVIGSSEAEKIIAKYDLKFVPTYVISADAGLYNGFAQIWEAYGTQEDDGSFVLRQGLPPYIDSTTGEVLGFVDVIYLVDENCEDCYNVTIHKTILQKFGMTFGDEKTVDISSADGQALLEQYSITRVPTVIVSSDAAEYPAFEQIWAQVGDTADDGSYIFTNMEQLQGAVYSNITGSKK